MKNAISSFTRYMWGIISSVNIRIKILGMTIGLLSFLGAVITLQVRSSLTDTLSVQLREKSIVVGRDAAARATDLILLNDLVELQQLLTETKLNNPEIRYAFIIDADGQVLVHTFGQRFPIELLEVNKAAPEDHHQTIALETDEGIIWDTAVPILSGRAGSARIGLSDSRLQLALEVLTKQLIYATLLVVILGVLVAISLTWVLTRPILEIVNATERVSQGDYSIRLNRWADDEIGDLSDAFNAMTSDIRQTEEIRKEREALRRQLLEKVITAQEDERRRISRELHDSTSQSLTSLMVGLKTMSTLCENQKVHVHAEDLRGVVAQTLEEIHTLSTQLRPSILDDLGLPAALERLSDEWQSRHKILVDHVIQIGEGRLPGEVETAIYRITQEALTNIAKYAQANSVSLLVEIRGQEIVAVIEDNGIGFDMASSPDRPHLGIVGMRERAELLGGQLTIESQMDRGTSIFVRIPIGVKEPIL